MQIIVKKKQDRYVVSPSVYTPSNVARLKVNRENRHEYDTEKRIRELNAKMPCGHEDAKAVAIAKMTCRPEHQVKEILKKKNPNVVLDGKIN